MRSSLLLLLTSALGVLASRGLGAGPKHRRFMPDMPVSIPARRVRSSEALVRREACAPKFFIISLFTPEANIWYTNMPSLYDQNITVPGFSPLFPDAHCTADGSVCQLTTGEGEINAACTVSALLNSNLFDLTKTYFMIAGIAGTNPHVATTGSVAFARYAVQFDLQYEFDARQIPTNWTSGYVPQNAYIPDSANPAAYPEDLYGTEVFELNAKLRTRFFQLAKNANLSDSASASTYRQTYGYAPANQPPAVLLCASGTSNVYWSGSLLGEAFEAYTKLLTNGSGVYCMSQQEDNAVLEALLRGDLDGKADFSRVAIMRTASDFDRAPPGETETYHLLYASQHGFGISIQNIWEAGHLVVEDVVANWEKVYKKGVKAGNFIGDAFNSLDLPDPDIGSESTYID